MESKDTLPTPAKNSSNCEGPRGISEIVAKWIDDIERGVVGPWVDRLGSASRLDAFRWLIKKHGILYAGCTLDSFEITRPEVQRPIIDRLRSFASDMLPRLRAGGGIVLLGPCGTGKDHLMFALMRTAIIEYGFTVEWHDGLQLQDDVRYSIREQKEHELRQSLEKPQILAISDPIPPIGNPSDWNVSFLRDVIDRRYRQCKSTWLTSNVLSLKDLNPSLSVPLVDRIGDESLVEVLQWPSHRKPAWKVNC